MTTDNNGATIVRRSFVCPCCGYNGLPDPPYARLVCLPPHGLAPPYASALGDPSYDVCACCGFEFGFDDDPGTGPGMSFEAYRADWIARGCPWFDPHARPADWDVLRQFRIAGLPT